jgi:cytochrome P450 family 135
LADTAQLGQPGIEINPSIAAIHRRADRFPDPRAFRPERFLEQPAGMYTWIPFGGGVRRCIGASFAQVEMRVVLREILRRIELAATSARSERHRAKHITLVPHRGARIRVHARRPVEQSLPVAVGGDA